MRKKKVFIGYYNIANVLTVIGLMFAFASCFFALNKNLNVSVICLIAAGICDLFDGAVARKIKRTMEEKEFGIQLDTIVDIVNFGIAPITIAFSCIGSEWYALVIYSFYLICAVVRLAYFNTSAAPSVATKHYQGLPVTYIALILPIVLFFHSMWITLATLAVVGVFFILNIKIAKPKGIWYLIFPIVAIILMVLWCFL